MITVPITVRPHKVDISIVDSRAVVNITSTSVTVPVSINYGLNMTQVNAAIDAKLTKENILGLKNTDSPEFSDTEITGLATEATYTTAVWSYLIGLFTTVPKSVKSHLVKIWERIFLLEDKYILKYVVPVDSVAIDLTEDKYGNEFNFNDEDTLLIEYCLNFNEASGSPILYINASSGEALAYIYGNSAGSSFPIATSTSNMIIMRGSIKIHHKNGEALIESTSHSSYSTGLHSNQFLIGRTNKGITTINRLFITKNSGILAGSTILIKRIK